MKFVLCALVAVAGMTFVQSAPSAEHMEKINAAMEICKPKTGATDEDIETLMKHELPETKTGQCFLGCMNKEFGVIDANNKVDVAHIKEIAAPLKEKDAEKYEKGMKIIETCAAEVNSETDECVLSKKLAECSKKEAAAVGILSGTSR